LCEDHECVQGFLVVTTVSDYGHENMGANNA
jgi:hypothetical protein